MIYSCMYGIKIMSIIGVYTPPTNISYGEESMPHPLLVIDKSERNYLNTHGRLVKFDIGKLFHLPYTDLPHS